MHESFNLKQCPLINDKSEFRRTTCLSLNLATRERSNLSICANVHNQLRFRRPQAEHDKSHYYLCKASQRLVNNRPCYPPSDDQVKRSAKNITIIQTKLSISRLHSATIAKYSSDYTEENTAHQTAGNMISDRDAAFA